MTPTRLELGGAYCPETANPPIPQQETQAIRSAGFDPSNESDGAATFWSILFGGDADAASAVNQSACEYFRDLNLDQIVESITVGRNLLCCRVAADRRAPIREPTIARYPTPARLPRPVRRVQ